MRFKRRQRHAEDTAEGSAVALAPPFAHAGPAGSERATFAAGCFWGVEAAFREIDGVLQTAVGYTGGSSRAPSYRQVCAGATGHAEAVEVYFDPAQVSYAELLDSFWQMHNPTTRGRQGLDIASQYRSAIFTHSAEQQQLALAAREHQQAARRRQAVTELTPASAFYRAEEYHQRYFEKSGRASCAVTLAAPRDTSAPMTTNGVTR